MNLQILQGDCREVLKTLPSDSIQCCVTSPPYFGLRDYGVADQIGQEDTPDAFVAAMVEVFQEVRRVLKPDGTCWINLGDSYAANRPYQVPSTKGGPKHGPAQSNGGTGAKVPMGLKAKDLIGIPWRVAFALQADGWWLRQDIIWHKPNPMPESVTDRCTKSHEYLFLLTKSAVYHYDHEAVKEQAVCGWNDSEFQTGKTGEHQQGRAQQSRLPGNVNPPKGQAAYESGAKEHRTKAGLLKYAEKVRESAVRGSFNGKTEEMAGTGQNAFRAIVDTRNKRSVWTVPSAPYSEAHFATYPPDLIKPCVMAGTKPGDTVLDPFGGSGTTGQVALELGRKAVLIELNPEYVKIINRRTNITPGLAF